MTVGGLAAAGPFMMLKGGISSKPSMSRLLGSAPRKPTRWRSSGSARSKTASPRPKPSCSRWHLARAVSRDDDPGAAPGTAGNTGRVLDRSRTKDVALSGNHGGIVPLALVPLHMMAATARRDMALVLAWILTLAGGAGLAHLAALAGPIVAD